MPSKTTENAVVDALTALANEVRDMNSRVQVLESTHEAKANDDAKRKAGMIPESDQPGRMESIRAEADRKGIKLIIPQGFKTSWQLTESQKSFCHVYAQGDVVVDGETYRYTVGVYSKNPHYKR